MQPRIYFLWADHFLPIFMVGTTTRDVCNHIARVRYVDKDGVIQTITPEDPMFKYLAGGFGRFGVIVDVSIRTILTALYS